MRARVQALVVDEQLRGRRRAPAWRGRFRRAASSPTMSRLRVAPLQADGDRAIFLMAASGNVYVAINPERVRQRIAGASLNDAMNILNRDWLLDPLHPPQIQVWPGIFGRLPVLPVRINVRVQES